MAQLKQLVVNGATRLIGTLYATLIQTNKVNAPTTAGGTTYGAGTSGQVLKTNGATVYWGDDNNTTYESKAAASGGTAVSLVTTGEKYTWNNKSNLALGTTSSTAFRGDYGNSAYAHAVTNKGSAFSSGLYKITTNSEGHVTSATAVAKSDITGLGIPGSDTTYESKAAASGGTAVSLVTTGEKYTWNNKGTYSKPSDGIPKTDLASAVQTSLGKADSALQSHQTIKQDGVTGASINRFGTCGTAAGTAAKTVDITTGTFALEAGARVTVKFTNANTAGTPTLNVNSKGAKNIFHKGSQITTGGNKALLAGTVDFVYDGTQWHLIGNYIDTTNAGTITGINMNGASKGTSGVVDLGTVITAHQDISGKADKSATVSTVAWDSTNKKITKTINGTTSDVVTAATILGNLTKSQVTTALGYTPPTTDTNTHRPIQVNGTEVLGNNTTALNLKAGSNVTVTNSSGTVTIAATDTTYESKAAASGGTAESLVTTGDKYNWNTNTFVPLASKTYTDVIATANDNNGAGFFYLKVRATTWNQPWHVKVRVHATVPGDVLYDTESVFDFYSYANTYSWFCSQNTIRNASYRPIYYNSIFYVSETGYNNDCGTWIGFNLTSSKEPTNTSKKRQVDVDLLQYDGCTVELQDSLVTPTNIPNRSSHTNWYSSTNTSYSNFDACSNGIKQTGDANTTNISNLMNGGGNFVADSAIYRYQLLFTKDENTLTPLNNVNNSTGTSKTMLTSVEFDPFGRMYYYSSTSTVSAGGAIGAGSTFWNYHGIDVRYTLNCGTTLTANKPIYLVVTPTSGGKCKIASATPWSQTLPSTNDGKWYIHLGRTYSTYQMALYHFHPVYKYDGSKIIEVTPANAYIDSIVGDVETLLAAI